MAMKPVNLPKGMMTEFELISLQNQKAMLYALRNMNYGVGGDIVSSSMQSQMDRCDRYAQERGEVL